VALTDAQMADVRRYAGYPLSGTTQPITADYDIVYLIFGMSQMSLYERLTTLSTTEETVLSGYLVDINALDAAIVAAGANLDTDQAAVWTHNKNEVRDRTKLFQQRCRQMCGFIGLAPGPGLGDGTMTITRG
jgi:hypothetical protein